MSTNLIRNFVFPAMFLPLMAGAVTADTVSITTFPTQFNFGAETLSFDSDAWADDASIASTQPGGTAAAIVAGGADGDLSTAANLNDSIVEIFFTDNILFNGPGNDLALFQNTNNNVIQVSNGGPSFPPSEAVRFIKPTDPVNTSGFEIGVAEFDLSVLGIADGAELSSVFVQRGSIFSTIWDVAALNSRSVAMPPPPPNPIPLPAAGWALLAGLGALIGIGRRRA